MTGWLLDTNVLSELRRPKPDANVVRFVSGEPLDLLHVSVVTFAEIRFGIELVKDASRRMELNDWLANKLRPMFEDRAPELAATLRYRKQGDEAMLTGMTAQIRALTESKRLLLVDLGLTAFQMLVILRTFG